MKILHRKRIAPLELHGQTRFEVTDPRTHRTEIDWRIGEPHAVNEVLMVRLGPLWRRRLRLKYGLAIVYGRKK